MELLYELRALTVEPEPAPAFQFATVRVRPLEPLPGRTRDPRWLELRFRVISPQPSGLAEAEAAALAQARALVNESAAALVLQSLA